MFDEDTIIDLRSQAVPIRELMNDPSGLAMKYRGGFKAADVVFGMDIGRPFGRDAFTIFSGRDWLKNVADAANAETAKVVVIAYDQRTDDLERLHACCEIHRGGCDYSASSGHDGLLDGGHSFRGFWDRIKGRSELN